MSDSQRSQSTDDLIHSTSEDVVDFLDKTEGGIRYLSEDPNLSRLHERQRKAALKSVIDGSSSRSMKTHPKEETAQSERTSAVKRLQVNHSSPPPSDREVIDFSKLSSSRSPHPAKWVFGETPRKQEYKLEKPPSNLKTEPSERSDLHRLVSSKSSHNSEWIIGGTPKKQDQIEKPISTIKTDPTPASDTKSFPAAQSPGPIDGKKPDLHKLLSSKSIAAHPDEWILGGAASKKQDGQTAKVPATPASDAGSIPAARSPRPDDGKKPDLHKLLSSKSTAAHPDEWILGGASSKKQDGQTAKMPSSKTEPTPSADAGSFAAARSPRPDDRKKPDLHKLLSSKSTAAHPDEWILGGAAPKMEAGQPAKAPSAAKAGPTLKSEWILQTEHVKDARALTPAPGPSLYQLEPTQSDGHVNAAKKDSSATTQQPKKSSESLSRLFAFDEAMAADDDNQPISPSTVKSEIMPRGEKAVCLMSNLRLRGRSGSHQSVEEKMIRRRRSGSRQLAEERPTERASSGSDAGILTARSRRHKRPKSEMDLRSSKESRSLMRFRSHRIRTRRKRRLRRTDWASVIRPTEETVADNQVIELTPLKSPISIDSIQRITRNGDQVNFRQVLRIYGSGKVEEPYAYLPRRTSVLSTRGMATVKYGTNMIEIAMQNTDIEPSKRGRIGSWIFTHSRAVHRAPIVFGKTKIASEKGPAPFCLSIAAPFWVSCHQEQYASSQKGERIRESIEVRQCRASGMPCYEMKPIDPTSNPLFSEHVYLGKGVIRIDRSTYIPTEDKWTTFFAKTVSTTQKRQYRVPLPWRGGTSNTKIPRAPPITDIRTTVRNMAAVDQKKDEKALTASGASKATEDGKTKEIKKKKSSERRRLPPPSQDVTGYNIIKPQHQERSYDLRSKSRYSISTSTSRRGGSVSDVSQVKGGAYTSDLPTALKNVFAPPETRWRKSNTLAGTGVVTSSRESSPEQRSFREIIGGHKESELQKDEIMTKKAPKKPLKQDAKQPPVLRAIKKEKPNSEPPKQPERSEKDGAKSEHVTTKSEKTTTNTTNATDRRTVSEPSNLYQNKPSSGTKASSSTSSDLGVVSDRAINESRKSLSSSTSTHGAHK